MKLNRLQSAILSIMVAAPLAVAGAVATTIAIPAPAQAATTPRPNFQLPFPCGEAWRLTTYAGHDDYDIDFFASEGSTAGRTILASAAGTVTWAGWNGKWNDGTAAPPGTVGTASGLGFGVIINHGGGWYTVYGHMVTWPAVVTGQSVNQGQFLGNVGKTGATRVEHLHYEQLDDTLDPSRTRGVLDKVESYFNGVASQITTDGSAATGPIYVAGPTSPSQQRVSGNCRSGSVGSRVVDYSGDRTVHVFARGTGGELWHTWLDGGWHRQRLFDFAIVGDPVAVELDSDHSLQVFARGTDGRLWHVWWNGTGWGRESFGVDIAGDPAAAVYYDGSLQRQTLHVFARGSDSRLRHSYWNGVGWYHESLESGFGGNPAVTAYRDQLQVFARWSDGGLAHVWWDGAWHSETLPTTIVGDPAALEYPADGSLQVFGRGPDNRLRHVFFDGTRWTVETLPSTDITSNPTATTYLDAGVLTLHVFAGPAVDGLYHWWWTGTQWGRELLDYGNDRGDPAAATYRDGSLQVFARSPENKLRHSYWLAGWHHETLGDPVYS